MNKRMVGGIAGILLALGGLFGIVGLEIDPDWLILASGIAFLIYFFA